MPTPTGLGVLALWPGFLPTQYDTPGFTFFETSVDSTLQMFFQGATGLPQPIFSVYTGETSILNNISGISSDFRFSDSKMDVGSLNFPSSTVGQLNINWKNDAADKAGITINQLQTGFDYLPFPQASIVTRDCCDNSPYYSEHREFLGIGLADYAAGVIDYGAPGFTYLANTFSDATFSPGGSLGAETQSQWVGWKWLVQSSPGLCYRKFGVYQDHVSIGTVQEDGVTVSNGGYNYLAMTKAITNPTSSIPNTAAVYYATDGNFKVFTNREISLAPEMSGISRLAAHSSIITGVSFTNGRAILTNEHNGKIVRLDTTGNFNVIVTGTVADGFTCSCLMANTGIVTFAGSSPLTLRHSNGATQNFGRYSTVGFTRDGNNLYFYGDVV